MSETNGHPLTPAGNGEGRASNGRFALGNRAGKGNPLNRRAQALRAEYIRAVTRADIREIVAGIVTAAKLGDVQAAKEVCDRVLGKSVSMDLLERIEKLEARAAEGKR